MSSRDLLKGVLCAAIAVLVTQALAITPASAQADGYTDIYVLGQRATTFSPHEPKDLEELKDLFDRFEKDLRIVLEQGGWDGNADDLFRAVRAAEEGDGTVTPRQVQPGESLQWMAYRKDGQPAVIRNPRWSAKKPFNAWQIKFESEGSEHIFVVPRTCMNLAYDSSRELEKVSCRIDATFDQSADLVTVTITGNGDIEPTGVGVPGGAGSLGDLKSVGTNKWTFQPKADGTYNFAAKVSKGRQEATCEGSVRVERAKPVCDIDTRVDPDTNMISVDASGGQGEFALGSVILPDGSEGDIAAMQSGGADMWTFDPSDSLSRKPGNYTYTFRGTQTLHGKEIDCEGTAVIVREAPEFRYIVRGFYAPNWPSTSTEFDEIPAADANAGSEALDNGLIPGQPIFTQFNLESGDGFGANFEYLFRPNLGLQVQLQFGDVEGHLMWDQTGGLWLMGEDALDFTHFDVGANYHFTPEKRVDFYLGAFVGWMTFDDVVVPLPEIDQTFRLRWDDQFTFGVRGGVDIPFKSGSPWIFTAGLDYILVDLDQDGGNNNLSMDPLVGKFGIGYRW